MMPDVATAIVNVIIGNIIDEIDTSVNKITNCLRGLTKLADSLH